MSDPIRFLTALAKSLSTMSLYSDGHPARERAVDASFEELRTLQRDEPRPQFSFLGDEVVYGKMALRDMKEWEWGARLANAGVQRLEFGDVVDREEYEVFLEEVLARLTLAVIDTASVRQMRPTNIKFGAIGIKGEGDVVRDARESALPTATIAYSLGEEAETMRWVHEQVASHEQIPLLEAEAVVRSLSVAMHGEHQMVLPLLQLKEFDQYTTTHSINVAVLAMGLAEFMGLAAREVRTYGVAGLLHDLGKVRIPRDILNKPGKLTEEERRVIERHPVDGARIIFASERPLELAAVVAYEHHVMINGQGYPAMHDCRACHGASHLVHVCDVYDALRTKRPYRDAWESEKALAYIEERAGTEFEPQAARAFAAMMRQWDKRVAPLEGEPATAAVPPAPEAPRGTPQTEGHSEPPAAAPAAADRSKGAA
jgi:putative nucleotidyltransferase with HDIG domain